MPAWSGGVVFPTWFPDIVTCGARRGAAPGGGVGVTLDSRHLPAWIVPAGGASVGRSPNGHWEPRSDLFQALPEPKDHRQPGFTVVQRNTDESLTLPSASRQPDRRLTCPPGMT